MVTNSFGNRNFMQPMARLGLGGGEEDFFHFSLFPTCSLQVLNGFPSGFHYVP